LDVRLPVDHRDVVATRVRDVDLVGLFVIASAPGSESTGTVVVLFAPVDHRTLPVPSAFTASGAALPF